MSNAQTINVAVVAVWAKAREHRALNRRQHDAIINPARDERDSVVNRAAAARDATIAKVDRIYAQQRKTLVASLRKELARTKRTYGEQIKSLGESTWDMLVRRALLVVGSPCELRPWQNIELTVPICQMVIWLEPARERAARVAALHRIAHSTTLEEAKRTFHEELSSAYEQWHSERRKARAIHKWGRHRRQRICKEFAESWDADSAIQSLSAMIADDEGATMPYVRAQEYLRRQKGMGPWPTLPMIMRNRAV